ncbi:MAG: hypothetical protein U0174_02230 [Polyangiaceae bacterium]
MRKLPALTFFAFTAILACGSEDAPATAIHSMFEVPQDAASLSQEHFFDHPWPSDYRRKADGKVHLTGFYNPRRIPLLDEYTAATAGVLDGFSPVASAYLRFEAALDETLLPKDPAASLAPTSTVQLIDVDPASPEKGKRKLVSTFFRKEEGIYYLPNTLVVQPMLGAPLRPKTRYAVVVTKAMKTSEGKAIVPSTGLAAVLAGSSTDKKLTDAYAPAIPALEAAGVSKADIIHLAVFTTSDPTAELFSAVDAALAAPAPVVNTAAWVAKETPTDYDAYEGSYDGSPNYQRGTAPYEKEGGEFVFEGDKPVLQNTFSARFALVVPKADKCPMPASGYPIVIYSHGTGGDYRSMIDDGTSKALAQQCLASLGFDQIFHGTRPGAPAPNDPNIDAKIQLAFFNVFNARAARTNNRQSAVDSAVQTRLAAEDSFRVPASVSRTTTELKFDANKVLFFGHSQGALNGPLHLAADKRPLGGVFSGVGSMMTIALLDKTKPEPSVAGLFTALIGLNTPDERKEMNTFHPVLMFVQNIVDVSDPIHYLPRIAQRPREGSVPKSILVTEGVNADGTGDSYAPPRGIEVASLAIGVPRMLPGVHAVDGASYLGLSDVTVPAEGLSGNIGDGRASGVLAQFVPGTKDGHFVVFNIPAARTMAATFCKNLANDPKGRVPALTP